MRKPRPIPGPFKALFDGFGAEHPRFGDFQSWCEEEGAALERFARFEAIALALREKNGRAVGWQDWPRGRAMPSGGSEHASLAAERQVRGPDQRSATCLGAGDIASFRPVGRADKRAVSGMSAFSSSRQVRMAAAHAVWGMVGRA
jgi:hypothetical protein